MKNTSKRRLSGAASARSIAWAMSRRLHQTENSRGFTGRSPSLTWPMRRQIMDIGVVSAKCRASASPHTLLQP